jgi:hypothetical protein
MATTEVDKRALMGLEYNYSLGETSGGIALIALAIIALAKIDPLLLNAIAVIVAGLALLLEGRSLMAISAGARPYPAAYSSEIATAPDAITATAPDAVTAGTLAGITGIVLGILAILNIAAVVLPAVAIIVFGAAVLFDSATTAAGLMRNSAAVLAAVALITLGIIALAGDRSSILVTVALLGLGGYLFLQNAVVAGSLFGRTA